MITVETHQQMDSLLGKLTQSIIIMGPRGKKFTFLATKKKTLLASVEVMTYVRNCLMRSFHIGGRFITMELVLYKKS